MAAELYLPILVFIIIGLVIGGAMLGAGALISSSKPNPEKTLLMNADFLHLNQLISLLTFDFI